MKSPMFKKPWIPATLFRIVGVLVVAALCIGAVIQANPVHKAQAAATCTSVGSGDWKTIANWDCGAVPGADDTVIIANQDITVSDAQAVKNVTIQNTGTLSVLSDLLTPPLAQLTIGGTLDVTPSAGGLYTVGYDDVTFDPISGGTIEFGPGGDQTLNTSGSWLYFWNLTKTGSGSLSVNSCTADMGSCDGGFEVLNKLTLTGADPNYLSLRSANEDYGWKFVAEQTPTIGWVDVKDSINMGAVITTATGKDSGGNSGWKFVGLSSSLNPSMAEQEVTFKMTLPDTATDTSLTFMEGLVKVACTDPVTDEPANPIPVVDGVASCQTGELGVGSHTISVAYTGGSASIVQVVKQSTDLEIHSSESPSAKDANVTFTAVIMPPTANGTVNFKDGDVLIAACTAKAIAPATGFATCTIPLSTVGNHIITAEFVPGAPDTEPSYSAPLVQSVKNTTSVAVESSNLLVNRYQTITLTATISSPAAGGKVTFMENGNLIANCGNVTVTNSSATCDVSALKPGRHNISVFYSGDANNFSSTSTAVVQIIKNVLFLPEMHKK